eukprot:1864643-Pyramimonas_sp.AAC.1
MPSPEQNNSRMMRMGAGALHLVSKTSHWHPHTARSSIEPPPPHSWQSRQRPEYCPDNAVARITRCTTH